LERNAIALAAADPGDQDEPDPAWDRLRDIACPTLVLVGEYDLAHIRRNARHLAETIPAAELVELAAVAHLPHLEGDPATLRAVSSFVTAR
jgi:pimeloyl-ACP methyl ester carboxylesterase